MPNFTATDWDEIRKKFRHSIMADTALSSLAQNLEIKDWPVRGEEEKPSKYFDFTWDELLLLPEIAGRVERAEHLGTILKETLAFDDPFGDMVAQVEATAAQENPILKTLQRLGIPEDFPLALAKLDAGTRAVCQAEEIRTIGQFATLAQKMAQRVVLGGEFRSLLNALTHGDEEGIGQFLPFRRGSLGVHLAEALGLAAAALPRADQVALARACGARLAPSDDAGARELSRDVETGLRAVVQPGITAALEWFQTDRAALVASLGRGETLERYLAVINDPVREAIAARLTAGSLPAPAKPAAAPRKDFFSRLFGRS
ncbi:MAG: hypothetical protein HY302_09685 [Opitutae bacterium]|nr:hypothetical protein [Opitutae bacterium]